MIIPKEEKLQTFLKEEYEKGDYTVTF